MGRAARATPQSLEAEQAVLGSMLLERAAIRTAEGILCADDFYREAHRLLFEAMLCMTDRGEPVDNTTLAAEMERRSQLEQVGGRPYLAALWDATPTAAHAEFYAQIVKEKGDLRRLITIGAELAEDASGDVDDMEELAGKVECALRAVRSGKRRQRTPFDALAAEAACRYAEADKHPRAVTGLPSGLYGFDVATNGFQPRNLSVLSARQGGGKTSFAVQVALNTAASGGRVLFCSLEMSEREVIDRMVCNVARINGLDLARGILSPEEQARRTQALHDLADLPIEIETACPMTPVQIRNAARELGGAGLALVVVDYIGLVRSGQRIASRVDEDNFIAHELRAAAKELGVPVLALSQHRKPAPGAGNRAPALFEIRGGSGTIDDAALVIMLEDATEEDGEERKPVRRFRAHVTKNRFGPCGEIPLAFHEEHTRFYGQTPADEE